jgi:hypothetical protein
MRNAHFIADEAPTCTRRRKRGLRARGAKRQMPGAGHIQICDIENQICTIHTVGDGGVGARANLRERERPAVVVETWVGH